MHMYVHVYHPCLALRVLRSNLDNYYHMTLTEQQVHVPSLVNPANSRLPFPFTHLLGTFRPHHHLKFCPYHHPRPQIEDSHDVTSAVEIMCALVYVADVMMLYIMPIFMRWAGGWGGEVGAV